MQKKKRIKLPIKKTPRPKNSKKALLRKKTINKRRNFFLALIIIILLWTLLAFEIYFIDPSSFGAIPAFFLLTFMTLFFTLSTLMANTRRGLVVAIGITVFLILCYYGTGNILNLLLITGLIVTIEVFLSKK